MPLNRYYYAADLTTFLTSPNNAIIGELQTNSAFDIELTQSYAWEGQISLLKQVLAGKKGKIYFEFSVPRMGKRIDVVVIIGAVVFVLEFKLGSDVYTRAAIEQVWDYALDLKNFHKPSHKIYVAPLLIATEAQGQISLISPTIDDDHLLSPINANGQTLRPMIETILEFCEGEPINAVEWEAGLYAPTPTIVEAAQALYAGHSVEDISRSDANATNLTETSSEIARIIQYSRENNQKSICFVTGVPGAGKTLVGLNVATNHIDKTNELYSVFLSGNGPLVEVLREALARNKVAQAEERGQRISITSARREVKLFIQNVHNFRDDCLATTVPPLEHVALFDEAQRAWDLQQTANFMSRKKHIPNFSHSEPEFLISCLDRHPDWATIVCLVGGGQEINTGEAGIGEWFSALKTYFPNWRIYISPHLTDSEYNASEELKHWPRANPISYRETLHLAVSMRSFRNENVSKFVKRMLDLDAESARESFKEINQTYPIRIVRDLDAAKTWVKSKARGSERYGLLVSSAAQRLKPLAIDVRVAIDPIHWFLDNRDDTRSSYYLEDAATEFQVQGLEVDWAVVVWDADFRYANGHWDYKNFKGRRWENVRSMERQRYLKNAYRVLLTRARQGMVIVVPSGDSQDPTRLPEYYDETFAYLKALGIDEINS